jgi:hypothetical protein
VLFPVVESGLDVSRKGVPDGDTLALGAVWVCAALLGDGGRLRKDFKMVDGERKWPFFFCGWLDMSGLGCKWCWLSLEI